MAWRRRIRNPPLSHFLELRGEHIHGTAFRSQLSVVS